MCNSLSSTGRRCTQRSFKAEPVEDAVWEAIAEALRQPELLKEQYQTELNHAYSPQNIEDEKAQTKRAIDTIASQEDRVTQAYVAGAMNLKRYSLEMGKLRDKRASLEGRIKELAMREQAESHSREALAYIGEFCDSVNAGLEELTFDERQELLRLLVERITVDKGRVRIETIIPTEPMGYLRTHHPELVEG